MVLLTVNIENSRIDIGFFEGPKLAGRFSLGVDGARTSDEYELLFRAAANSKGFSYEKVTGAILASVVPTLTSVILTALKGLIPVSVVTVGPGIRTGFSIKIDNPAELGADLAADAAGAIALYGCPVFVVNFGTVTALSVIDATKAYLGGALLPGVGQSVKALHSAELLPEIGVHDRIPLIGTNTRDCMRTGVIRGQAMAVCGMIRDYQKALGLAGDAPVVVTGAFAPDLLPYLGKTVKYAPDLTLTGLAHIFEINACKHGV